MAKTNVMRLSDQEKDFVLFIRSLSYDDKINIELAIRMYLFAVVDPDSFHYDICKKFLRLFRDVIT